MGEPKLIEQAYLTREFGVIGVETLAVARTGRETQDARGGQVSPGTAGPGPLKREASRKATQAREGLALAA